MHLIIGLGNPGREYENTRHNLGFKVIEELAARRQIPHFKSRCKSLLAESSFEGRKVVLAMPQTFMNLSGEAAADLLSWYKIDPQKLVLIYDDIDLEAGQIRIRPSGSAGGHHGVESIINQIKTSQFARIRVGIGRENVETAEYVLQKIPAHQEQLIAEAVGLAANAAQEIISAGLEPAMNKFNSF